MNRYVSISPTIWLVKRQMERKGRQSEYSIPCHHLLDILESAQHRMHLTAFGVGMLAFFAGFGICWLVFVR